MDSMVTKEFDGETFYLVSKEIIDGVEIYKFDTLLQTVYCVLQNGEYKRIDRNANLNLSKKIKDTFESYETDVIFNERD